MNHKKRKKKEKTTQDLIFDKLIMLSKSSLDFNVFLDEFSLCGCDKTLLKDIDALKCLGLKYHLDNKNKITLKTRFTPIDDEVFCIVDIETNSHSIENGGQIIEIGAIKVKGGKILDEFQTLVKTSFIPPEVTELTGINANMTKNAPNIQKALYEFRMFLQDSIFVAHDVKFDYNFISKWYEKIGFPPLFNSRLCTIDLAKKCIKAPKYGLESLKQILNINLNHHRALDDAKSTLCILCHCTQNCLPVFINTTQDLINFSKNNIKNLK